MSTNVEMISLFILLMFVVHRVGITDTFQAVVDGW